MGAWFGSTKQKRGFRGSRDMPCDETSWNVRSDASTEAEMKGGGGGGGDTKKPLK